MFIKMMNYPQDGMERLVECEEFLMDSPKPDGCEFYQANIVKRVGKPTVVDGANVYLGEFETEIIEIKNTAWAIYVMSSDTGRTVDAYHWTRIEGQPITRSNR